MKALVLYSSRTGNTKKVAEALRRSLPEKTLCLPIKEAPTDLSIYDCIFIGFWIDKGTADTIAAEYIKNLHHPHIALFATLGADPDSKHAKQCMENAAKLIPDGTKPINTFICQGAIDPKIIEMMYKMFPAGHPHGKTPENDALHERAAKHPNEVDFKHAAAFAKDVWAKIRAEV